MIIPLLQKQNKISFIKSDIFVFTRKIAKVLCSEPRNKHWWRNDSFYREIELPSVHLYFLCYSKNGYTYCIFIKNLEHKGHTLYVESFYSNINLMKSMAQRGIACTCTLNKNWRGALLCRKNLKKENLSFLLNLVNDIMLYLYQDRRLVKLISKSSSTSLVTKILKKWMKKWK